ncbi:hypothetical protein [Candidatus Albibeggiatoa sp. nov. NOAA]|uniref:hypothetical protein n=1 Tax=Candidatus Albibeggiatoa sp. nov. NOAA TaxID=3162724 RepID=UPI0032F7C016|nr:hypothetical protein [Thiotrichaceae bacterium]
MPKQFKKVRMLALASAAITTSAMAGGKGDGAPTPDAPEPLTLNQIPHPLSAMVPPINDSDFIDGDAIAAELSEDFSDRGVIFTDESSRNARIDFIIGNLPAGQPLDVILAYTTNVAPFEDDDVPFGLGGFLDDDDDLRRIRADGDELPPPNGDGVQLPPSNLDGQQPPLDGQGGDGQLPPPDGQGGDGQLPPPDGQGGDGQLPPPDGQGGDGQLPPSDGQQGGKITHKPGQKPGNDATQKRGDAPLIPNDLKAQAGQSCLGDKGFEVVAGVSVQPVVPVIGEGTPTKVGRAAYVGQSVVISVSVDQLADNFELGDELFFQAMAFPAGTFASGQYIENINQALISECDRLILDLPDEEAGEFLADGDESTPDSGGKDTAWLTGDGAIYEEDDEEYAEYDDGTDEGTTDNGTDTGSAGSSSGSKDGKVE